MTADHEIAASLLGAWALDACSATEAEVVMAHISHCPECADEAVRLRSTAALLAHPDPPPAPLRAKVLASARATRPPAPGTPPYAAPYAAQVSVLDALLTELTEPDWQVTVLEAYDWTVQDLVAHLAASDGVLAGQIGVPTETPTSTLDLDARTAAMIATHRGRPPQHTRDFWRAQATALCARLTADEAAGRAPAARLVEVGWPLRVGAVVIARAFETWIHSTDIAGVLGRPLPDPLPQHLHRMADLGVRSLPQVLPRRSDRTARILLSGSGGGDWLIPLGSDGASAPTGMSDPAVTLELDVLEFCFLAGGRRDPDALPVRIEGDETVGRDLLAAAPAFSGP